MAVWLRLWVERRGGPRRPSRALESGALVNSGYRAEVADLLLPTAAAERVGLWPELPANARAIEVEGVGGKKTNVFGVASALRVHVVVRDRKRRPVPCDGMICPGDPELLSSDALMTKLGIVILDGKRGIWCFRDEIGKKRRRSAEPQVW